MIPLLCIIPAALIVLAAIEAPAVAWVIGRLKRRARSYTNWSMWQPAVPSECGPCTEAMQAWDVSALDPWPTAEEAEQAVYDAMFTAIPLVAADLREAS